MKELNYLLNVGIRGVIRYDGGEAMAERVREWFANPVETISDNPSWGVDIHPYQFDPESSSLAIALENSIVSKMPRDIDDLRINRIRVSFSEFDQINIYIETPTDGWFDVSINRAKGTLT